MREQRLKKKIIAHGLQEIKGPPILSRTGR